MLRIIELPYPGENLYEGRYPHLKSLGIQKLHGAKYIHQTITSALANLQQEEVSYDADNLYIKKAFIDQRPTMKRFRPVAMGRSVQILKRTSHLTISISDDKN